MEKKPFLLILLSTFLNAFAQYMLKVGTGFTWETVIWLVLGLGLYGMSSILLILVLREGAATTYYPVISLTFVWVILLSHYLLQETISTLQMTGILFILIGVFEVTR